MTKRNRREANKLVFSKKIPDLCGVLLRSCSGIIMFIYIFYIEPSEPTSFYFLPVMPHLHATKSLSVFTVNLPDLFGDNFICILLILFPRAMIVISHATTPIERQQCSCDIVLKNIDGLAGFNGLCGG